MGGGRERNRCAPGGRGHAGDGIGRPGSFHHDAALLIERVAQPEPDGQAAVGRHVRIDGERADGERAEVVGQRPPGRVAGVEVGRVPEASARGSDEDGIGVGRVQGDGGRPARVHRLVERAVELGPRGLGADAPPGPGPGSGDARGSGRGVAPDRRLLRGDLQQHLLRFRRARAELGGQGQRADRSVVRRIGVRRRRVGLEERGEIGQAVGSRGHGGASLQHGRLALRKLPLPERLRDARGREQRCDRPARRDPQPLFLAHAGSPKAKRLPQVPMCSGGVSMYW